MTINHFAPDPPFRIFIIGAGMAGLTAAISLGKLYPADAAQITIYEKAAELREIGAAIGINPSGLRTLDRLGVEGALDEANLFRNPSGRAMTWRHWLTGEELSFDEAGASVERRHVSARFHRAHLQRALVEALPPGVDLRLAARARAVGIRRDAEGREVGVVVSFGDGSEAEADLLIGADGIHSTVRKVFAPECYQPKWTGMIAFRAVFDYSLVKDIEGLPDESLFWAGHGRFLLATRLGKNQYAVVGDYHCDPNDANAPYRDAKWDEPCDVEFFRSLFRGWNPVVQHLVDAVPHIRAYPNHSGAALPSLVFHNRVALLGDAGHAHGAAFGAGGSLAINDAYALSLALAEVWPPGYPSKRPSREQLGKALRVFDETRRPLVTRLLHIIHGRARAMPGGEKGGSDEELRRRTANRPDMSWLSEHDVEAELRAAFAREDV